ncbi:Single-strand binding protein family protein [Ruminococcaceae bacterium P7]|nr:Single-strand binding protein family protein [Ruminococcaceae bacterium P7]
MLNTCIFVGRVSTEIELKKTKNQKSCCNFQMAVRRSYSDEADFPPLSVYGNLADILCTYAKKGDMLGVRARFRSVMRNEKKYSEFLVEEIQFLQRKDKTGDYDDIEIPQSANTDFNPDSFNDDDLPF